MKPHKYKVMAAVSSFLLASICLTASTFAWFSLADELKVENVKIGLKSSMDIEFGFYSEDSRIHDKYDSTIGTWVDNVFYIDTDKSDVTAEILSDFGQYDTETAFTPVSSAHVRSNLGTYDLSSTPVLTKMPSLSDVEGSRAARKSEKAYLQFECYIRSKVEDVYLFINNGTDIAPDLAKNAETAVRKKTSVEALNNVVDYMRMSFYTYDSRYERPYYTIYEPHPSETDYQNTAYFGRLDIDPSDGYYDFNYRTMNETIYGNYSGTPSYSEEGRATEIPSYYDGFKAISHPSANCFSLEESLNSGFIGVYEESTVPEDINMSDYHHYIANSLGFVANSTPQRFVISCWAEGWDLDCNTLSSEASFVIDISITAEPAARYTV